NPALVPSEALPWREGVACDAAKEVVAALPPRPFGRGRSHALSVLAVRAPPYRGLPMYEGSWTIKAFDRDAAALLARELEISGTAAAVLVRRGYDDAARARAFLAGELPAHDPFELGDMAAACDAIRGAIAAGRRICVHGDYDADGICATALALLILRELGAEVESHLPSRFDEGYGVRGETLSRLADDGCGLVLTVDCGVTAVDEVAHAKEPGLGGVGSDRHRAGGAVPGCPGVGPYRGPAS